MLIIALRKVNGQCLFLCSSVVVCDDNRWRCVLSLTVVIGTVVYIRICWISERHSGFPSKRINLSPFTKDFRGGEQFK
jgi:hypothetical protein